MVIKALCELNKLYDLSSIEAKRYLVGILFPEKIIYAEWACRTPKLNKAAKLIYAENKELRAKKEEKISFRSVTVRNSNHFVDELMEIGGFSKNLN